MIKSWIQFIKESKQLELFQDEDIFPYTEEDIRDYLLEIEDNKYSIDIKFGWKDKDDLFTKRVESHFEEPCIAIEINSGSLTKNEDVTSGITSFIKRISKKAKAVKIYDNEGEIPIKLLKFEGGIFLNDRPEDSQPNEAGNYDDIQIDDGILILCIFNKRKLTYKDIFEYYRIRGEKIDTNQGLIDCLTYSDKGTPIFEAEVCDLTRWIADRNDTYIEYINNPDSIWDHYVGQSYYWVPDHDSFFRYYMSDENRQLLLKVCVQKDGWEAIIEDLGEDITQEDFIKSYRNYRKLGEVIENLSTSSDIYNDLRNLYVNFQENAKAEQDLEEIISKFDELVEEQFKTSIIGKNRYTKKLSKTNKNGEKYEYDHEFETYKLSFSDDWFDSLETELIIESSTYNILANYSEGIFKEKIKPYFKDYADVDEDEFNKSVKSDLEHHLKKTE